MASSVRTVRPHGGEQLMRVFSEGLGKSKGQGDFDESPYIAAPMLGNALNGIPDAQRQHGEKPSLRWL